VPADGDSQGRIARHGLSRGADCIPKPPCQPRCLGACTRLGCRLKLLLA
jgi:hypothetical protein